MEINLNLLFIVTIFVFILYEYSNKTNENFADTTSAVTSDQVKQMIKDIYLADIDAIRNLSNLANKLATGGYNINGKTNINDILAVKNGLLITNGNKGFDLYPSYGTEQNKIFMDFNSVDSIKNDRDCRITMEGGNTTTPATGQDGNERGKYSINTGDIVLNTKGTNLANNTYGSGTISLNGKILTPANNYIECAGRQYINGSEYLYLVNKNGVVIGKDSGGNGDLQVQGNLTASGRNILTELDYLNSLKTIATGTFSTSTSFSSQVVAVPTLSAASSFVSISNNGFVFSKSGIYNIYIYFKDGGGAGGGNTGDLRLYLKEGTNYLATEKYVVFPLNGGSSDGNGGKPYITTSTTEKYVGIFPSKHSNNGGGYGSNFYYSATIVVDKAQTYYIFFGGSQWWRLGTNTFSIKPYDIYT